MNRSRVVVLVALFVSACGSNNSTGSGGGTASGGGTGTGGGVGTGGGSGADAGTLNPVGRITLTQLGNAAPFLRAVDAAFYPNGFPPEYCGIACTTSVTDGCTITDCFHDGGPVTTACDAGVNAGALTTSVGGVAGPQAPRDPATGLYKSNAAVGTWWAGGETASVSATGSAGGVPAFSATLTVPSRITLVSPTGPSPISIARNAPYSVTWTGTSGTISVGVLSGKLFFGRSVQAVCTAPASAGSYTIPAAVTGLLLPTGSNDNGSFVVDCDNSVNVLSGAYAIDVIARHEPTPIPVTIP
ncbi:MAG: hypothetical protein LH616_08585 [Ilumatobacteraceae bacterium]|nr:hypothetical protein [Ilumatobacteraceae bacterium]